ncbi:hypothetical protein [Cohnella sp.]|uniref:hypothetical protein n=1 Tax=Cohnella sp. TaxID=1883426 RepID=UPI0035650E70
MTDNKQKDEAKDTILENQFLDPPISPHYRRDEPEQTAKVVAEMPDDEEMRNDIHETKQNDGYKSICRE